MMQNPPAADRVLILRLGAMGDVVRTLPAVAALRGVYPGAHLTWLVEPASAGVVSCSGLVDEVLIFPRGRLVEAMREGDAIGFGRHGREFLETLRERRFQISIDFHGLLKTGMLALLSGAPIRFGYPAPMSREFSSVFATHHAPVVDPESSRFDRNAALIETIAPGTKLPGRALLAPSALAKARLNARLRATGRESVRDYVLIHPGSSAGAQHKRYSPEGWARVARELAAAGRAVWIACGPNRYERSLTEDIVRRAEGALVLAPETRSFDDLLALQARASLFVAADSGPLHAASLAGVPVLQLMGPTHPVQNLPWAGSPSERIRVPLACSPCRRGCEDPACMRVIAPAAITKKVNSMLDGHAAPLSPPKQGRTKRRPTILGATGKSGQREPSG
ncbi:glycosyltransferase family 9 protein [Myxococcota bacterium]|nr:glycosyltransferase family 9 protein [Myxococcota bacterium]